MKLIELIKHLRDIESAKKLLYKKLPNAEFSWVELYMVTELAIDSDIEFFDIEEMEGRTLMEVEGIRYVDFLPLNIVQEMVEAYKNLKDSTFNDYEIAQRILEYSIYDG